jgi:asparagine synthetase B (glutamine-hydrolysing)
VPGIFGVSIFRQARGNPATEAKRLLAGMLEMSLREDFYEDLPPADCGAGSMLAVSGLPEVGRRISPSAGSTGVSYGQVRCEMASSRFDPVLLGGFFSLACVDAEGTLWVVADKRASEPVYYTTFGNVLCFAPEVQALSGLQGVSKEKDCAAMASLIVAGHLYSDQTLYRGIRRLKGGHALRVADGNVQTVEYWRFAPGSRASRTSPVLLASELADRIVASVPRDLAGSKAEDTAVFLSGGYDSRAILGASAAVRSPSELRTVTWGLDEGEAGSDAAVALHLSQASGTSHRFFRRGGRDYGPSFEESCRYTEWQSDVAAFHPEETAIMRQLRGDGFRRVLRGDEAFGWKRAVSSLTAAPFLVGLRPFHLAEGLQAILRPEAYREMSEASRPVWEEITRNLGDAEPNQVKDRLYFTERLQNYLNSAAVYKRAFLDHRNPLLSDEILEFMSCVPDELREHKELMKRAVKQIFPSLAAVPLASKSGLEDWEKLMHVKSSFRSYLLAQLADRQSPVWEIFRRDALERLLAAGPDARLGYSSIAVAAKVGRQLGRSAFGAVFPSAKDHFRAALAFAAPPDKTKIFMRFLVIKNWCDHQC